MIRAQCADCSKQTKSPRWVNRVTSQWNEDYKYGLDAGESRQDVLVCQECAKKYEHSRACCAKRGCYAVAVSRDLCRQHAGVDD